MLSWVIIVVLGLMAAALLKATHIKHRVTLILVILFALFLTMTISVVAKTNDLDVSSTDGFVDATKIYLAWLGNGFKNLRSLAGNAIKMDWTSTEEGVNLFNKTLIPRR